ncbi:class I SAM-dependent methyltransferase [Haloterrigena alkaliphila]|uniref:Class I SAM-dependent methyltransferase n=1 Tax=Haloterrigena alkaliphila TaxID=2816475 RepID=A0A8A2VT22_9EURY|nr:class I SAM-dependent methyltransferase [Haloterrigena alkaliphila]QSX01179.1 class I SAM-dependent methyltransferase [Haloterrigena alkaliphila]
MSGRLRDAVYALRKARLGLERRRLDYGEETEERAERLARVLPATAEELRAYEREYESLEWFHDSYADRVAEIHDAGVATDTTHWRDGVTLYVVCRALEVETAVETGVLYGSFDAHVLAAMEENGGGTLHSVDLPDGPPGPFEYGHLIPDRCRDRWELHRGDAREVLPTLLERVGSVDLFLHDSDHRLPHMRFEYETALSHLAAGGVLASHDVRLSRLFDRFTCTNDLRACVVCDTGIARIPSSGRTE